MHHFCDAIVMNAQEEHATTSSVIGTLLSHGHRVGFIFLNTQIFHNVLFARLLAVCVSFFLHHAPCPNLSIFYYLPVLLSLFVWLSGCCLHPCRCVFLHECLPRLCLSLYPSASCNLSIFLFFSPLSVLNFFSILLYSILLYSTLLYSTPFFSFIFLFHSLLLFLILFVPFLIFSILSYFFYSLLFLFQSCLQPN